MEQIQGNQFQFELEQATSYPGIPVPGRQLYFKPPHHLSFLSAVSVNYLFCDVTSESF